MKSLRNSLKLSAKAPGPPASNTAQDAPQNQIESSAAVRVEVVDSEANECVLPSDGTQSRLRACG
jgi:hypothetical protein